MLKTVRGTVNHYDESGGGERGSFAGDGGGEHKGERGGREGEEGGDWNKDAEFFMQQYRTVLSFKVSFYDDSKAVWQPLLEPWQLQCVLQPGGYDPKVEIAIEAATAAQINVTRGLIEVLRDLAGQFVSVEMAHRARTGTAEGGGGELEDKKTKTEEEEEAVRARASFNPYVHTIARVTLQHHVVPTLLPMTLHHHVNIHLVPGSEVNV
jgi:hypothetical protein